MMIITAEHSGLDALLSVGERLNPGSDPFSMLGRLNRVRARIAFVIYSAA
jgi:hypothetical protein